MKWEIGFSAQAKKFIERENLRPEIISELAKLLKKMRGESVSIDIKKLKGDWQGFYRIRKGEIRIIFELDFQEHRIIVSKVDYRGNAYR